MYGHALNYQNAAAGADDRVDQRHAAFLSAVLIKDGGPEKIEILNIARLGFLARSNQLRETGESIVVQIESIGTCQAHVVWANSDQFGGRFVEPIDMAGLL